MTALDQTPDLAFEHRWATARWLVDRHPALARLLSRAPGLLDCDGDPDVDLLAQTLNEYDQYLAAWNVYKQRYPAPDDGPRWDAWCNAGPQPAALVSIIGAMSPSERARLRMIATFSVERVALKVLDFTTLDDSGRSLLTDWTLAVLAS